MGFLDSQIETRVILDDELSTRAYAELAASVTDGKQVPRISNNDVEQADAAAVACLHYLGVEPGAIPVKTDDIDERLEYLCRPSGTMRRMVRLEKDWYRRSFGAMVGQLDTGEPVAILPGHFGGFRMVDPLSDRAERVTPELAKHLAPQAIYFYKPFPQRPLRTRDLASFLATSFDKVDYIMILIAALVATLAGMLPAWANKVAFSVVVPSGDTGLILPIAALLVGVTISISLINICRNLIMKRVGVKLDVICGAATFARVLSLPTSFFKDYNSGNLGMRVMQVTELIKKLTSLVLGTGLTGIMSLVYLVQLSHFAPGLAVPSFIIVSVQVLFILASGMVAVRYERATTKASAHLSGTVTTFLGGIRKIKLAGAEERAFARWAHDYAKYAKNAFNRPAAVRAIPALVGVIGALGTIVLYFLATKSGVGAADYMAFNVAFGQMAGAVMALAQGASQVATIRPMFELVQPILDAQPEIASDKPSVSDLSGAVDVSGITFRYDEHSPNVLNNLSFHIKSGEYVAFVGESGCGKSTIMRLLLGFETADRGTIFYDSYDINKVDLKSLRQSIGVVLQDGKLFMGDILSNITISTPGATIDDAWEAAELAGVADDIRNMPMGMQTIVSEGGGGISGGQRQRIMIARAICGKRRILMFDEATSALDNITQRHVIESLDSLNCTRIAIAHRLSTVRNCDRILVVRNGRIEEQGSYEELIAKNGFFAELVERQRITGE